MKHAGSRKVEHTRAAHERGRHRGGHVARLAPLEALPVRHEAQVQLVRAALKLQAVALGVRVRGGRRAAELGHRVEVAQLGALVQLQAPLVNAALALLVALLIGALPCGGALACSPGGMEAGAFP